MKKKPYEMKIIRQVNDSDFFSTFDKDIKYYCRKCKFYEGKCTLNRVIRICRKKRLKDVPIQESERR